MRISDWSSDVCSSDLPQRLARHRLQPVGESVSRLRARLRVLLRPALARLSRPVARAGFRDQAVRQDQRGRAPACGTGEARLCAAHDRAGHRSEEHTSELQSLMRISYAVFCLKKKKNKENK